MLPAFAAFEMMIEETINRSGPWHFEYDEIDRIGEVQKQFRASSYPDAVKELKKFIDIYFAERGVPPIIKIDLSPPCVTLLSGEAAEFILAAKRIRGNANAGKQFEDIVARQLANKLTGTLYSIGYPRKVRVQKPFKDLLESLGIDSTKIRRIQDGGLDVIWQPPLGKKSELPFVNFQCKNTEKTGDDVKASFVDALRTCSRHRFCTKEQFPIFVVVNTYLTNSIVESSFGRGYAFLGLPELMEVKSKKCS